MAETPQSIWQGSFRVFGIDVKCHVLDNGQRMIEEDSMLALFAAEDRVSKEGWSADDSPDIDAFFRWQKGLD